MNIKDCIREIIPALSARIEGQVVYPVRLNINDGVGYKFACPYCCEMQKRPSKKREKCARIYPLTGCYTYQFQCSKCTVEPISIHRFLQEQFPYVYKQYKREKNVTKQIRGERPAFKKK